MIRVLDTIAAVCLALSAFAVSVAAAGRHEAFEATRFRIQHGGLQDFDGDAELQNQLHRDEFVANKEHLQEHLTDAKIDLEKASSEELEFHFFKLHDVNVDLRLDGLELLHAVSHGLAEQVDRVQRLQIAEADKDERLDRMKRRRVESVDRMLADGDTDQDGYLSWVEFVASRRLRGIARQKVRELNRASG